MCGHALNAGFQFARSKVPNDKAWRNTFDQVQADWGTRKHLSRRWARILTRRMRHRKLQAIGMEDQKNKRRVFLSSMRVVATDGVRGRGKASFWRPVVRENMLGYVSKVPGIGVGTGVLIQRTKRIRRGWTDMTRRVVCVTGQSPSNVGGTLLVLIGRRAMLSSLVYAI